MAKIQGNEGREVKRPTSEFTVLISSRLGKHIVTWFCIHWSNRAELRLHLNVIYCDGDGATDCPEPSEDDLDC